MAPPKGGDKVADVLAKFRTQQVKAAKVQQEASKLRQERLKKIQNGGISKRPVGRPPKSRAKSTASSSTQGTERSETNGDASPGDWRKARKVAPTPEMPLGMRQKQVVDFLRRNEGPASISEILSSTGRNLRTESDLSHVLLSNPKLSYDESSEAWTYQPEANVKNKQQLLEYIRKSAVPVTVKDLEDAYHAIFSDLSSLKKDKLIYALHSYDPDVNCEVLFPVDLRLSDLDADENVRALWSATEVPEEDDVMANELEKVGLQASQRKPTQQMRTRDSKKKRKKRKPTKLRAVTNVHLMHLLEGDAPASIDTLPNDNGNL